MRSASMIFASDAAAVASAIEKWFEAGHRPLPWRAGYDPYQVWVSEVMLQQTRMDVVIGYFSRFITRFPNIASLAAAPEEDVVAAWSGLGYYRRARMLHKGARRVVESGGSLPRETSELRAIPGIGRYTAGAIASIAFEQAEPIVDGNVARVLARLLALEQPMGSPELARIEWEVAAALVGASRSPRSLNQGLMELGALVCRVGVPDCGRCPVAFHCRGLRSGRPEAFPAKRPSRPTRALTVPLFLITDGNRQLLMTRGVGSLMRGMLQLPVGNNLLFEGAIEVRNARTEAVGSFSHTITNRRIRFEVIRLMDHDETIAESRGEFLWVDPAELDAYPHPSYVKKALRIAGLI